MKRYLIHRDENEAWHLVFDPQEAWMIEHSGCWGALRLTPEAFHKTDDGKRLGEKLAETIILAFGAR